MSKADSKITTAEVSTPLADALFDLESELHSVKNLSHAIFMMAGSMDINDEPRCALQSLADVIIQKMDHLCSERVRLWNLAKAECVQ
jgi:hypothetical protein